MNRPAPVTGTDVLAWSRSLPGDRGRVWRALTARRGGVSASSLAGLNLGEHVGDDPSAVSANRATVAAAVGVAADHLLVARQVHGGEVVVVDGPWPGPAPEADALVTSEPDLALAVLVADCVPVMLVAPDSGVVAVAHAGRRGMDVGVVPAALDAMAALGAGPVHATLGPSVCARCYEVPAAMRDDVAGRHPAAAAVSRDRTPSLDVAAGVLAQLRGRCAEVDQVPGCTVEDEALFSHRRDPGSGRFAGMVWREAP